MAETESEKEGGPRGPGGDVTPAREAGSSTEELLDRLQRERADFLNYKRRTQQERAEDRQREREEVVQKLLPLLDELDRGLSHIPEKLKDDPWAGGIGMSRSRIARLLQELGVERVGTAGDPFDPAVHEALFFEERPEATGNLVGEVLQPGYRLGDRLIRPARVMVIGPGSRSNSDKRDESVTEKSDRGHRHGRRRAA